MVAHHAAPNSSSILTIQPNSIHSQLVHGAVTISTTTCPLWTDSTTKERSGYRCTGSLAVTTPLTPAPPSIHTQPYLFAYNRALLGPTTTLSITICGELWNPGFENANSRSVGLVVAVNPPAKLAIYLYSKEPLITISTTILRHSIRHDVRFSNRHCDILAQSWSSRIPVMKTIRVISSSWWLITFAEEVYGTEIGCVSDPACKPAAFEATVFDNVDGWCWWTWWWCCGLLFDNLEGWLCLGNRLSLYWLLWCRCYKKLNWWNIRRDCLKGIRLDNSWYISSARGGSVHSTAVLKSTSRRPSWSLRRILDFRFPEMNGYTGDTDFGFDQGDGIYTYRIHSTPSQIGPHINMTRPLLMERRNRFLYKPLSKNSNVAPSLTSLGIQ